MTRISHVTSEATVRRHLAGAEPQEWTSTVTGEVTRWLPETVVLSYVDTRLVMAVIVGRQYRRDGTLGSRPFREFYRSQDFDDMPDWARPYPLENT